jgi:hypothetical protein
MEADALSSQSADSNPQEKSDLGLVQSSMRSFGKKAKPAAVEAPASAASDTKISSDRKERWGSLLGKRPATKDGDSMSAWLMEVLAVSDLDTPLKSLDGVEAESAPPGPADDAPEKGEVAAAKKTPSSPFKGGIVKKKRPAAEALKKDKKSANENLVSGSFAEWKERKKAKKQAKMNPSQEAEV